MRNWPITCWTRPGPRARSCSARDGGLQGSQSGVIPLDPLPGILAGQGIHGDIAVNATTRKPDDTGEADTGGAGLSGNGQYAFFFTEADSNLAPASIFDPGSTLNYLVRKNLLTGVIDVASIGPDGHTPVKAAEAAGIGGELPGNVAVNTDGSAVVFTDRAAIPQITLVHNFTTQTSSNPYYAAGLYNMVYLYNAAAWTDHWSCTPSISGTRSLTLATTPASTPGSPQIDAAPGANVLSRANLDMPPPGRRPRCTVGTYVAQSVLPGLGHTP